MSVKTRSPSNSSSPQDLKGRVIGCLNKLADRDTLAVASAELDTIARNLSHDSFSPFLTCIHNTDSSCKSPVRKKCVNLLTLLSHSHGDTLSPHLSKMISTITRRLRDSDSAVRSACVEATSAMCSHITNPPFSLVSKPLIEMLVIEQDVNSQIGAAMCLAAAIEATAAPDAEQLRKLLPRLGKLVRSERFKAKAPVLGVIGSVVGVGYCGNRAILGSLVPCVIELLSCEDWATRKAAAETLGKVATAEKELATDFKAPCVTALENRRFDKVKVVRETMNRTLDLWKEVPGVCKDVSSPSTSKSSSFDNNGSIGCFPSLAKSSSDCGLKTSPPKRAVPTNMNYSSNCSVTVTTAKKESPLKSKDNKSNVPTYRLDRMKPSDWEIEIAESRSPSKVPSVDDIKRTGFVVSGPEDNGNAKVDTKHVISSNIGNDEVHTFSGLRSRSRVIPYHDDESPDHVGASNVTEEVNEGPKDPEDLSLIREQLAQIENQQSNLFELLQKFIGSSQSGIHSLATRVHGLEMALDEISYDFAISSRRVPNADYAENTCCKLPGAEFLSPKFWRKSDGRFCNSRFSSSARTQTLNAAQDMPDKDCGMNTCKPVSQRLHHHDQHTLVVNPLANGCSSLRDNSGFCSDKISKNFGQEMERVQICNAGFLGGVSSAT